MTRLLSVFALFAIAALPVRAQTTVRPPDVPSIVTAGFAAYESKDSRAAIGVWLNGSPASSPATVEQMIASFAPIELAYGSVIGHEIVRVVPVTPSFRRIYAIIRYERGPLFVSFDCYQTSKDWIIPMLLVNTRASELFPASVLGGEH